MKRELYRGIAGSIFLIFAIWQTVLAEPPEKPGNSGMPGLLAEIAELNAQIEELEALIQKYEEFAPIPKTGQTTLYETGDDGDMQAGVQWPFPRFTDNSDGTVTDNLTGLIWLKNANCFGERNWFEALNDCNTLADGQCGLTDGSTAGDWRLPDAKEFQSLIHYGVSDPTLPDTSGQGKWSEGDPFTGVDSGTLYRYDFWSSTTAEGSGEAIFVFLGGGFVDRRNKNTDVFYVWPVRDAE